MIAALTMGFFYKLNEARFAFIIEEINQRKKNNNIPGVTNKNKNIATVNL